MDSGSSGKAGPLTSCPHVESADGESIFSDGGNLLEEDLVSGPHLSEPTRLWDTCSPTLKLSPWPLAPLKGDGWAKVGRKGRAAKVQGKTFCSALILQKVNTPSEYPVTSWKKTFLKQLGKFNMDCVLDAVGFC